MKGGIPAITGDYLIELLEFDGWKIQGRSTHGVTLKKFFNGRNNVTTVPTKIGSIPDGTLGSILSVKQTCLGKPGLVKLIERYNDKM